MVIGPELGQGGSSSSTSSNYLPVYNVKSYGALGIGTDDTTFINKAISAITATGLYSILAFPAGVYGVSSSLLIGGGNPGGIMVEGTGWNSQIKLLNGSNCYIFDMGTAGSPTYTPGPVFKDIYLNCNAANQTGTSGGIFAEGSVFGKYDHVWFDQPYDAGLRFYQDGLGNYGHHNTIVGCLFTNGYTSASYGQGLRLEQCDENSIIGCTFQDNGTATYPSAQVYDHSAGIQSFLGCHFVTTRTTAVTMVKTDSNPSRCSFIGCHFDSSTTGNQMELNGDDCTVSACVFLNFGGGTGTNAAIHMSNNNTTVTACNFTSTGTKGQAVLEDSSLTGNSVTACTTAGTYNTTPFVVSTASVGILSQVATTIPAGVAKTNGAQTFLTYTTPNDGKLHTVMAAVANSVTSTETGGQVSLNCTIGGVPFTSNVLPGAQAPTTHIATCPTLVCDPNTTVTLTQSSNLTSGASKIYATFLAD